jgi:hypothetical protein
MSTALNGSQIQASGFAGGLWLILLLTGSALHIHKPIHYHVSMLAQLVTGTTWGFRPSYIQFRVLPLGSQRVQSSLGVRGQRETEPLSPMHLQWQSENNPYHQSPTLLPPIGSSSSSMVSGLKPFLALLVVSGMVPSSGKSPAAGVPLAVL